MCERSALQAMLYQVRTNDPAALLAVAASFALLHYLPAYRASRIDPSKALRTE